MEDKRTGRDLREVETKGVQLRSLKEKYHTGEGHTLDTSYVYLEGTTQSITQGMGLLDGGRNSSS